MGCATGTIKYSLFVVNTVWAVLGILAILFAGLGWDAMPQKYAIGLMVLGSFILIISLFGCFGAIRESPRMLWTYVTLLVLVVILDVVFMCFTTRDVFKKYALKGVEDLWQQELIRPGAMDTIQMTYSCCGRNSAEDYVAIGRLPPSSCCKNNNCINPLNLYVTGCLDKVEESFSDEADVSKYFEWGILAVALAIIVLSALLAIHYRGRERRFNY